MDGPDANPVTVAQLRAALSALPDDMIVLIPGYEGDMTGAVLPTIVPACRVPSGEDPWYYGEWREPEDGDNGVQQAVLIAGVRHN